MILPSCRYTIIPLTYKTFFCWAGKQIIVEQRWTGIVNVENFHTLATLWILSFGADQRGVPRSWMESSDASYGADQCNEDVSGLGPCKHGQLPTVGARIVIEGRRPTQHNTKVTGLKGRGTVHGHVPHKTRPQTTNKRLPLLNRRGTCTIF